MSMVEMKTSMGNFVLELFDKQAPGTVVNFLKYVDDGHYNGTIFHRVIDNFMIQGGGFDQSMRQIPAMSSIKNEAGNGVANDCGTIAMARISDPDSATCQFFINVADNAFLNHKDETAQGYGYCAFGKVVKGMDVIEKIKKVKTGSRGGHDDVPLQSVVIMQASRTEIKK
jgi:peptidyl-prolyl cis-trans isomerase B (cyclophilin B)